MSEAGTIIQKLGRNERPMCGDCEREMWFSGVSNPRAFGLDTAPYECSRCGINKLLLVEPERNQPQSLGAE